MHVAAGAWQRIAGKRIFFGHQSVGSCIIGGIEALKRREPGIDLEVGREGSLFQHRGIGSNGDPFSKIDHFVKFMRAPGEGWDLAFFKFCYVDFHAETDVQGVMEGYREAMSNLKRTCPGTRFAHVTVPLVSMNMDIRDLIKRVLGRGLKDPAANVTRARFNNLLRKEYQGRDPIFDLAEVESTFTDGKRCTFYRDGAEWPALVPAYTYDGGHLNEDGALRAAEHFLDFLARSLQ